MPSGLADTCKARDKKEGKEFDIETIRTSVFFVCQDFDNYFDGPRNVNVCGCNI